MLGVELKCENQAVAKYFSDFKLMKRQIGEDLARNTKKRCDQLKAASDFSIYLSTGLGKPHALGGDLKGCYGISISPSIRLIVKPIVESIDPTSLRKCDAVIIRGVVDYHGQKYEWLIP